MTSTLRVTVWNEYRHELTDKQVSDIYPQGIHGTIAEALSKDSNLQVRTATLDEPEHGLSEEVLNSTDVLTWWGHMAHPEVSDEIVDRVQKRVLAGMGLIVLHSAHYSKIFQRLMGTTCNLKWREENDKERLWIVAPGHPITEGLGEYIEIEHEEMYGEHFDIPAPRSWSLWAGLLVAKSFVAVAATPVARAKSSISVPATRPCPPITIPTCSASLPMPFVGPLPRRAPVSPSVILLHWKKQNKDFCAC